MVNSWWTLAVCFLLLTAAGCREPVAPDAGQKDPTEKPVTADNTGPVVTPAPVATPASPVRPAVIATDADIATLVSGYNQFAFDLYHSVSSLPGNLFFSPYGVATAFTMTSAGASGATAEQMMRTLRLPDHPHAAAGQLADALQPSSDAYQLNVANRLWAQQGLPVSAAFRDVTSRYYGAGIATLDFVGATEAARVDINDWVSAQTRERIPELIAPGMLNTLTRLVLTNAIYFKGTWLQQFDPGETRDAAFLGAGSEAPLMHQQGSFAYSESGQWQAVRLPYQGDSLSMVILLPLQRGGLGPIEAGLDWDRVNTLLAQLRVADVAVWLPRFSASSQFLLNKALSDLGMPDAFTPGAADFSGITGSKGLYISKAIHKAFVEVNEEGAEAAAATAVVMGVESAPRTIEFRADHPFVFLIIDDRTGALLFLGRLTDPGG